MSFAKKIHFNMYNVRKTKNLREEGGQVKNTLENLQLMGIGTQGGIKTLGDRKVRRGEGILQIYNRERGEEGGKGLGDKEEG